MSDEAKTTLSERAADLANEAESLREKAADLAVKVAEETSRQAHTTGGDDFLITGLSVFVLACFVGYYVVWRVTPALHSPLMGITNAISSVIIVGALIAAGPTGLGLSKAFGLLAVILASVNIFGGFIVTRRMLHMYKKKG